MVVHPRLCEHVAVIIRRLGEGGGEEMGGRGDGRERGGGGEGRERVVALLRE